MTKVCPKCKEEKELSEFHKDSRKKLGVRSSCKVCVLKVKLDSSRTVSGLVEKIYSSQKSTSKKRGHNAPEYSLEELKQWFTKQPNFTVMYDTWVASDYNTKLVPTVDRLDTEEGYSMDNIQLLTFKDNSERHFESLRTGELIHKGTPHKPVIQTDLKGVFIAEYCSTKEAARQLGIKSSNISRVCNGTRKKTNGFIFKFKEISSVPDKVK